MNSRSKLLSFILAILLTLGLAACGGASSGTGNVSEEDEKDIANNDDKQEVIEWDVSLWGAPRAFTYPIEEWAETMKEETDGHWIINLHYGETLGPATDNIDGISAGLFEAAGIIPYWTPGKLPLHQVVSLPFLQPLENDQMVKFQMAAWENDHILGELEKWNAVPLLPGAVPQAEYMGHVPVEKVEDFKGLRIAGLGAEASRIFEEFGAIPTPMEASEIYSSQERGTIDGTIYAYSYSLGAYSLHEASKYYTRGLASGQPEMFVVANKDAWEALPEDFKKLHQDYYNKYPEISAKYYAEADKEFEPIFEEMLTKIDFPADERAKLQEKSSVAWDEWKNNWKDRGPTDEILDFMLEKRKEIAGY